jgi:phosphatidylglycerophosphate synthase
MAETLNRRPLASRDSGWAKALARRLAATRVSPNQVSVASIAAAAMAGAALWASGLTGDGGRAILLLLAAAGCQLRLVCNLLDGLLAVEAGRRTADGAFWNEFPDRISDTLILVGLGLGLAAPPLGWAAAAMAILTAYTRELGQRLGMPADYRGPMAKPQRMALVTTACVVSMADPLWDGEGWILLGALWLILVGSALTVLRRAIGIVRASRTPGR